MKKRNIATIRRMMLVLLCMFLLSSCGKDSTQRCVYKDEAIEFYVDAPESWSYAIHKQAEDEKGQPLYDTVDMILYPQREEENRICILHKEAGEPFIIEETGTPVTLNAKLQGTQTEDVSEAGVVRYIVLEGGEYSIIVICEPDFYEKNQEAINTVLESLKIK